MPKPNEQLRKAAVWLLRTGTVTVAEIAHELKISRQLMRYWANQSGVDYRAKRQAFTRRWIARAKKFGGVK